MPWIPSNTEARLPRSAIVGGRDKDGAAIYIGRAWIADELVPCNVIPGKKKAYGVSMSQTVVDVQQFEVLCGDVYLWKKANNGDVPGASLIAGRTKSGEELYIGRIVAENGLYPGVIRPSWKKIVVAADNVIKDAEEYDTITIRSCEKSCGSCTIL